MNHLKFEGKGLDYFKLFFVDVILAFVSLTLLYPRALVREARYLWSETSLGGTAFEFRGKSKVAFNGYMKVLLLMVIFIMVMVAEILILKKSFGGIPYWAEYTNALIIMAFVLFIMPVIIHGDLNFFVKNTAWRSVMLDYKGKLSELMSLSIRGNILTILTLGIFSAWYETQLCKFLMENIRFGSLRFTYSGSSKEMFRIYLKGFLLGIVTLGIYNIWNFRDLYNYSVNHTVVRKGDQEFNLHSDANTREVFELLVGNALLVAITLGFGFPWACIRLYRFMVNHCEVPEAFNLDSIEDNEVAEELEEPSKHWLDKWNPNLIA
ncbi:MAG TPA: DUF898 family protein [Bacteroidales bacterium]|nr:DUF898 family protein [Bacteroidales bacterium]